MARAQAWGLDLIIASSIFIAAIVFFYIYTINYPSPENELKELQEEAGFVVESILSEGYPSNWNKDNVVRIGILSEEKLNETKFEELYDLTLTDYSKTKKLFKIKNNYYIEFSSSVNTSFGEVNFTGLDGENAKNLAVVTRVVPYEGDILTVRVVIWN